MAATWAITPEASSPLPFNMPICLERELRLACSSWVRVCRVLRSASRVENWVKSIAFAAGHQAGSHGVEVVAEQLNVEHGIKTFLPQRAQRSQRKSFHAVGKPGLAKVDK